MVTDGLCSPHGYMCKAHEATRMILDCDHNQSDSETKYNTRKEKIKMNEKSERENAIPSNIFLFHGEHYSYGKKERRGQRRTFPFLFKTLTDVLGTLRANGCHRFVLCMGTALTNAGVSWTYLSFPHQPFPFICRPYSSTEINKICSYNAFVNSV